MTLNRKDSSHVATVVALLFFAWLTGGCTAGNIGLAPVHPKDGEDVRSDSLQLEWKRSEEPADSVRYQLVIFDENEAAVYEAPELIEPRHTVNADLGAGKYYWQVRPLYFRANVWKPGAWNQRKYAWFAIFFMGGGTEPYEFDLLSPIHAKRDDSAK